MRFLYLCLFCCVLAYGAKEIINGTAASVGDSIITIHDVNFYGAVELLKNGGDAESAFKLASDDTEALKPLIQRIIFEEMVNEELVSFKFTGGSEEKAQAQLNKIKKLLGPKFGAFVKRFSKNESQLLSQLRKSLRVEDFVQKKVETLTPIITEAEVERYYEQQPEKFGKMQLAEVKESIRLLLQKQRVERGLEEWVRFLKNKYRVASHLQG